MIAFLVFLALMIAFIVGSVCVSMRFYLSKKTGYPQGRQLVTMSQTAFIGERSSKQCRNKLDWGMNECAWRVCGISLGVVTVMLFLIITFFCVAL
jgi:hypothetical protein